MMLAILITAFMTVFISSVYAYYDSYIEEIDFYQQEVRAYLISETFTDLSSINNEFGIWPADLEKMREMSKVQLENTDNFVLSDSLKNPHKRYIHYDRSAEVGSKYESDRAVLLTADRETEKANTILSGENNNCGSADFNSGRDWCKPSIPKKNSIIIDSSTSIAIASSVAEQEVQIRHLSNRISNYMNVNEGLPPTPAGNDVPLYRHVRDRLGNVYDPSIECGANAPYSWDGIPITCADLFSNWHVDTQGENKISNLVSHYELPSGSRFDNPVRIYRNGNEIVVYTETPFERYGQNAWDSTAERRGETRPNSGSSSYIFTSVTF